jgi:hypothetical protein
LLTEREFPRCNDTEATDLTTAAKEAKGEKSVWNHSISLKRNFITQSRNVLVRRYKNLCLIANQEV